METLALKTFLETARAGSFTAAARLSGVDPSVTSRTVAALEAELGFRLFQRTTRRLALTEAGQAYFDRIAPLVEELELARDAGQALTQTPQGLLRVTASVAFGYTCITPWLREFRARYPALSIEMIFTDAVVDLVTDSVDVAVRLSPAADSGLIGSRLMRTHYRVCASPTYLRAAPPLSEPAQLAAHECIVFPLQGFRNRWHFRAADGATYDVSIRGTVVISNALALLKAACDHVGPALLPNWLIRDALATRSLIDVFPNIEVTATEFDTAAWILYPSRRYLPLKVRVFVDFLKEKLRDELI